MDGHARGLQVAGDALLDAAVDLGDQVVAVGLGLDAQLLTRVQGEGGRLADRSHPAGEQLLQAGRRRPVRRLRCHCPTTGTHDWSSCCLASRLLWTSQATPSTTSHRGEAKTAMRVSWA